MAVGVPVSTHSTLGHSSTCLCHLCCGMADGVPVSTHSTLGHSSTCVACVTCEVEDAVWLMVFL